MYQVKSFEFKASEIASITDCNLLGADIIVNNIQQLQNVTENSMSLCYFNNKEKLTKITTKCLIFCANETVIENKNISYIITEEPRLTFFRFILENLVTESEYWINDIISKKSEKYPNVKFGYNNKIGKGVIIAPNVTIGSNCSLGNNVVIRSNTQIGDNCVIKDNSVIGSEGFGYINTETDLIHIPQIGYVKIGNDVTIGSNCAIEKPALGYTIIHDAVKIDDLVQIGHNQEIGRNTIITTGFKAEGGVKIGENSFIGMGVTIISKKITVGNNCLIGAGTVLTKTVGDNKVVYNKFETITKLNNK